MNKLYREFLSYGYMPEQFYRLSVNEAIDVINVHRKDKEEKQKEELQKLISVMDLFGSNLIEKVVGILGKSENDIRFSMLEYFPELFPDIDKKSDGDIGNQALKPGLSKEMQLYKAQRIQHAFHVNRKNREKEEAQHGR